MNLTVRRCLDETGSLASIPKEVAGKILISDLDEGDRFEAMEICENSGYAILSVGAVVASDVYYEKEAGGVRVTIGRILSADFDWSAEFGFDTKTYMAAEAAIVGSRPDLDLDEYDPDVLKIFYSFFAKDASGETPMAPIIEKAEKIAFDVELKALEAIGAKPEGM